MSFKSYLPWELPAFKGNISLSDNVASYYFEKSTESKMSYAIVILQSLLKKRVKWTIGS